MDFFKSKPHFGEVKVPIKFKILVRDIRFDSNEYFLEDSTYSIFQEKNKNHKLKNKKNLYAIADCHNIEMGDTLKFHATLFKKNGAYLPKTRKLVLRQNSKLGDEKIYKDIGFVELPLDKIVLGQFALTCRLDLVDPDKLMEAHINVNIKYKFLKPEDKPPSLKIQALSTNANTTNATKENASATEKRHEKGLRKGGEFNSAYAEKWNEDDDEDYITENNRLEAEEQDAAAKDVAAVRNSLEKKGISEVGNS